MSKDFWKGFFAGLIAALFVAYSFFRLYWIEEVGLKYFRWHAVLWFYVSIALVFAGLSYLLYKSGKLQKPAVQKTYLIVLGLFAGIYLTEIVLRLTHVGISYSEIREGVFVNPAERTQKTWYMVWQPHQTITLASGKEYSFTRQTNSLGLSDKEWTTKKDSNEIRIITLGDSFTEGDGCTEDSSYPRVMEHLLQNEFPQLKINVMNAARCGSDPWFDYKKLHDLLLPYQPDIVIYTNSANDLQDDHLVYGGMERFLPDSTVKNKIPQPRWLGLYGVSYFFRMVINFVFECDNSLFTAADRKGNEETAIDDSRKLSHAFSQLAVQNNFRCIQLLRPQKFEMRQHFYDFDSKKLLTGFDTLANYTTIDLLSFYLDSLHIKPEQVKDYFWAIDGHHNSKGYAIMARGVALGVKTEIQKRLGKIENQE